MRYVSRDVLDVQIRVAPSKVLILIATGGIIVC